MDNVVMAIDEDGHGHIITMPKASNGKIQLHSECDLNSWRPQSEAGPTWVCGIRKADIDQ